MVRVAVKFLAVLALALPAVAAFDVSGLAQDRSEGLPKTLRVAVVDLDRVKNKAVAWQSIRQQFDVYRKAFQKQAEEEQKNLRAARDQLRMQQSLLSPEAMRDKERKYQAQTAEAQRRFEARKRALEKSYSDAINIFEDNLKAVLEGLVKEMKIELIINRGIATVYTDPDLEITEETLKRLDARIKKITVKKPVY